MRLEDFGYSIRPVNYEVPNQNGVLEDNLKESMNRIYKGKRRLENQHEFKSVYCKNLYNEMRNVGGYIIGNLITPLIYGKILYTPKTNLTYKIIQKVIKFLLCKKIFLDSYF